MQYFFDTCALLNSLHSAFELKETFFISSITLKELESIKTSVHKDENTKAKARKLTHLLDTNEKKYKVINYSSEWTAEMLKNELFSDNNDSKIIYTAMQLSHDVVFVTDDICCKNLAKAVGLNVKYTQKKVEEYKGYKEILCKTEDQIGEVYNKIYDEKNPFDLKINQYLIIKDCYGDIIDKYKQTPNKLVKVPFWCFESKMFGKIKPKDAYQAIAMDALATNQISMVRGAAGTGKSYLSFGFLFNKLEKHEIDKIIIFCNTVATTGSAKLGYYPGSRDEKLLDSQIGNLLASKLGDKSAVERMIDEGTLVLLPMSDIRGYDTTGMKAGVYISEAQNLDIELMRLALQRIGEDCICILDGDSDAQVDLGIYAGSNNGMKRVSEIFKGEPIYGEVTLKNIHRSRIAQLAQLM